MTKDRRDLENLESVHCRTKFCDVAASEFSFLVDMGLLLVEARPTLLRYENKRIEVDIYLGRQSNELGLEIVWHGIRFSISELIRATAPDEAERYRSTTVTSDSVLVHGLAQLADLARKYAAPALIDDEGFFDRLQRGRMAWSEKFALDVLEAQLRPKASEAFHRGDYREAAELYEQIRPRLTASEMKKLMIAKERS